MEPPFLPRVPRCAPSFWPPPWRPRPPHRPNRRPPAAGGRSSTALTSRDEFENYHLRLEVKWGDKKWPPREKLVRDSGLLYHCVGPHGAGGGFWMKSFESQIQEGDFGDFWSVAGVRVDVEADVKVARRTDPKTGKQTEARTLTYKRGGQKVTGTASRVVKSVASEKPHGQWNVIELYAVGRTAVHVNNGVANMVLTNLSDGTGKPLTKGRVQFQSEGAEVFFRRIAVRPIDAVPAGVLPPASD